MNEQYCVVEHYRNQSAVTRVIGPLTRDEASQLTRKLVEAEEQERPMLLYYTMQRLDVAPVSL